MFISAEGARQRVCRSLPVATRLLVAQLARVDLQVSDTKTEGIASSPSLALALSAALRDLRIRFGLGCKSLGGDLSATRNRRAAAQHKRITSFKSRRTRFARLRAGGVHTARFFRAGWNAAVSWGLHVVGIATTPLQAWRREVARGCAAAAAGKSVDLVLILADSRASQTTDPAFEAHALPLVYWAHAVWAALPSRGRASRRLALRSAAHRQGGYRVVGGHWPRRCCNSHGHAYRLDSPRILSLRRRSRGRAQPPSVLAGPSTQRR